MADHQELESRHDADCTTTVRRILDSYDHPPANGRVICLDEFDL